MVYSPWDCKESDMTEGLTFSLSFTFLKRGRHQDEKEDRSRKEQLGELFKKISQEI